MSNLTEIATSKLWDYLYQQYGDRKLELEFTKALVSSYYGTKPNYIPFYEFVTIQKKTNINSEDIGKKLVNFLCYEIEILELNFRLIDDEDNQFELNFDVMQEIISGQEQRFGSKTYSANSIKNHIFTYFIPNNDFLRLMEAGSS